MLPAFAQRAHAPEHMTDHRGERRGSGDPRVEVWVSDDGIVRHELRNDGTYSESRGGVPHARGRWWKEGSRIVYLDDRGWTASAFLTPAGLQRAGLTLSLLQELGGKNDRE